MARGGGVSIGMLAAAGVGILVLAIVFMLAPTIPEEVRKKKKGLSGVSGGQMENAMPALGASSNWNSTYNTGLKTGPDVWEQLSPFLIDSSKSGIIDFTGWNGRAGNSGRDHHLRASWSIRRHVSAVA